MALLFVAVARFTPITKVKYEISSSFGDSPSRRWPRFAGDGFFVERLAGNRATVQSRLIPLASLAQHRPLSWWAHARGRRGTVAAERFLHRAGKRRRVEDERLRPHLDANFRRSADWFGRLHCGIAFRSERRLRWQRRRIAAA